MESRERAKTIERFGKYILLERLASGGMAEVYLAKSPGADGIDKYLAIKRILPQYSENEEFIKMFKEEAKIAVNLNHSNIVAIYNFGIENNQFYLVMEYVEGQNLRQILNHLNAEKKDFSIDQVIFIAKEVSAGLDHAHRCLDGTTGKPLNITHRDMSPQNIMISFEGEVKIVDFGIAKSESRSEHTRVGTIKGKFGYMSPEQAEGQDLDIRTDIFSLGIVLWELLANERLFSATNEVATMKKIRECRIPSLRKVNPSVHPELERIVNKALIKDKTFRYQTAAALHKDLNRFLNTHYPDFSPHEFSLFMKSSYSKMYMENRQKLTEYAQVKLRPVRPVKTNRHGNGEEKDSDTDEQENSYSSAGEGGTTNERTATLTLTGETPIEEQLHYQLYSPSSSVASSSKANQEGRRVNLEEMKTSEHAVDKKSLILSVAGVAAGGGGKLPSAQTPSSLLNSPPRGPQVSGGTSRGPNSDTPSGTVASTNHSVHLMGRSRGPSSEDHFWMTFIGTLVLFIAVIFTYANWYRIQPEINTTFGRWAGGGERFSGQLQPSHPSQSAQQQQQQQQHTIAQSPPIQQPSFQTPPSSVSGTSAPAPASVGGFQGGAPGGGGLSPVSPPPPPTEGGGAPGYLRLELSNGGPNPIVTINGKRYPHQSLGQLVLPARVPLVIRVENPKLHLRAEETLILNPQQKKVLYLELQSRQK